MFSVSNQVHGKGMKFGIYEDYGNFTCAGYPGIIGHMDVDADTFASWDVDYVKLDGEEIDAFQFIVVGIDVAVIDVDNDDVVVGR